MSDITVNQINLDEMLDKPFPVQIFTDPVFSNDVIKAMSFYFFNEDDVEEIISMSATLLLVAKTEIQLSQMNQTPISDLHRLAENYLNEIKKRGKHFANFLEVIESLSDLGQFYNGDIILKRGHDGYIELLKCN